MNTRQLQYALANDCIINGLHYGVYPSDKLPRERKAGCYIVNEDVHAKPGSHWVAVFIPPEGGCEYFDSYGRAPAVKHLQNWLKPYSEVVQNLCQVQAYFSTTCGHHCLYVLYNRARDVPYQEIIQSYSSNLAENDTLVRDFLLETFCLSGSHHEWQTCAPFARFVGYKRPTK